MGAGGATTSVGALLLLGVEDICCCVVGFGVRFLGWGKGGGWWGLT